MLTDFQHPWRQKRERKMNMITELGELGQQCSQLCGAEGDQKEDPAATIKLHPLKLKTEFNDRTIPKKTGE